MVKGASDADITDKSAIFDEMGVRTGCFFRMLPEPLISEFSIQGLISEQIFFPPALILMHLKWIFTEGSDDLLMHCCVPEKK